MTFGDSVPHQWFAALDVTCLRTLIEQRMARLLANVHSITDVTRYLEAMTERE